MPAKGGKMKAIVTGGLGFVGSNLCQRLVNDNWKLIVIDDLSTGYQENHIKATTWLLTTLGSKQSILTLSEIENVDVIFHLAAVPRVTYSIDFPFKTANANVLGTIAVLEYARTSKNKPRVIYSSSSSIYGGTDILPTPETCPANPQSPYALQKWQGEEWCRMYSKIYGIDTVCLRYHNIFGRGSRYGGSYSTVLSAWLYSTLIDPSISPYIEGDGFQTRDFTFVDNVVEANILAATSKEKFQGDAFNIGHGQTISLMDCKKTLEEIFNKKFDLEKRPDRKGDVRNTWADISKARKILKYNPVIDFKSQLEKMAKWYCHQLS